METASGVTFTGSGSFNLAALSKVGTNELYSSFGGTGSLADSNLLLSKVGSPFGGGASVDNYSAITSQPPAGSFGSIKDASGPVQFLMPSEGSGPVFGIGYNAVPLLVVPQGYVSGTTLSASSVYGDPLSLTPLNFANFGLTPGTYVWSWGTGPEADSLVLQVGGGGSASVPSPLPLVGAGAALGWSRRLRRRLRQRPSHFGFDRGAR
ncbi:MAG: hypothetical protein VKJ05_01300 [Synechococcaceae cyanobacterium]|nr:hypothetical protein [Synechococcaceae cyanobacterium]